MPPNGRSGSAIRSTSSRGGSMRSAASVIRPDEPSSIQTGRPSRSGNRSIFLTSLRHDGNASTLVIAAQTTSGATGNVACRDATWSRGSCEPTRAASAATATRASTTMRAMVVHFMASVLPLQRAAGGLGERRAVSTGDRPLRRAQRRRPPTAASRSQPRGPYRGAPAPRPLPRERSEPRPLRAERSQPRPLPRRARRAAPFNRFP